MRANNPSHLISSEINLRGGKTEPRVVKGDTDRTWGREREAGRRNAVRVGRPVKAVIQGEDHINI